MHVWTVPSACPAPALPVVGGPRGCPPGVTVAIPNWNHEYVLPRSIQSSLRAVAALRSRDIPAEVLVIDDASRDGSVTLLRQLEALHYADGLRLLALAQNVKLPSVRNLALREARYRYVVFLDADNELLPENLHHFYRAIVDTRAAAVFGNLLCRRLNSGQVIAISAESFQSRMFDANYIDALALFDRVQLGDVGDYTTSAAVASREDWELYLHLAALGRRIVFVPLVFGLYHDMPGSMIKESLQTEAAQSSHLRRVFNQLGLRDRLPLNTRHLRYHPDIGYL